MILIGNIELQSQKEPPPPFQKKKFPLHLPFSLSHSYVCLTPLTLSFKFNLRMRTKYLPLLQEKSGGEKNEVLSNCGIKILKGRFSFGLKLSEKIRLDTIIKIQRCSRGSWKEACEGTCSHNKIEHRTVLKEILECIEESKGVVEGEWNAHEFSVLVGFRAQAKLGIAGDLIKKANRLQ